MTIEEMILIVSTQMKAVKCMEYHKMDALELPLVWGSENTKEVYEVKYTKPLRNRLKKYLRMLYEIQDLMEEIPEDTTSVLIRK